MGSEFKERVVREQAVLRDTIAELGLTEQATIHANANVANANVGIVEDGRTYMLTLTVREVPESKGE
jgi:GMP synthase PP-ATPase subunit